MGLRSQLWCLLESRWWLKQNESVHPGAAACTMASAASVGSGGHQAMGRRRGWGREAELWWLSPGDHTLRWLSPGDHGLQRLSPGDHFPPVSALVLGSAVLLGLPLTKNRPGKENLSAGLALSQAFRWKSVWPGYPRYLILDYSFLCWQELLCQKLT